MKHALVSLNYCHTTGDLLKSHALLTALPQNFVLRSSSYRSLQVDPGVPIDDMKALVRGWTEIVKSDGTIFYRAKNSTMSVTFQMGRVDLQVYSSDSKAEELADKAILPFGKFKFENKEEGGVWVNFCYSSGVGVDRNTQFIRCPRWEEIQENYASTCQGELSRTMKMKRPWADGRLMIWHGEPGTGKTFAIRSLLMAWRDKFNFVIVTDPEKLMASPSYYYEVSSAPNMNAVPGAQSQDNDEDDPSTSKKKRLLFIIEDSADLISTESRQRHWDKFGKLLNITDGLIGQGREDIFLLTFNEQLASIDPAIIRPGRCISQLEFNKLTLEDAERWLAKNGLSHLEPTGADTFEPASLAELYQMKAKAAKPVPVTV